MAAKKRHSRHDNLVANIIQQPIVLKAHVAQIFGPSAEVEQSIVEWEVEEKWMKHGRCRSKRVGWADLAVLGRNDKGPFVFIVEVKSELEKWTAGDVIRQLKRYATVVATREYERLNVAMAFYCDRVLTEAELVLLNSEGVYVLK